jgi:hypothetical protein
VDFDERRLPQRRNRRLDRVLVVVGCASHSGNQIVFLDSVAGSNRQLQGDPLRLVQHGPGKQWLQER